jgi:hypothetical protein
MLIKKWKMQTNSQKIVESWDCFHWWILNKCHNRSIKLKQLKPIIKWSNPGQRKTIFEHPSPKYVENLLSL